MRALVALLLLLWWGQQLRTWGTQTSPATRLGLPETGTQGRPRRPRTTQHHEQLETPPTEAELQTQAPQPTEEHPPATDMAASRDTPTAATAVAATADTSTPATAATGDMGAPLAAATAAAAPAETQAPNTDQLPSTRWSRPAATGEARTQQRQQRAPTPTVDIPSAVGPRPHQPP